MLGYAGLDIINGNSTRIQIIQYNARRKPQNHAGNTKQNITYTCEPNLPSICYYLMLTWFAFSAHPGVANDTDDDTDYIIGTVIEGKIIIVNSGMGKYG